MSKKISLVGYTKYLAMLWDDTCNVYERQDVVKPNGATIKKEVLVLENEECKLSEETIKETQSNSKTDGQLYTPVKVIKLFLRPDVKIKTGSKIEVTHCGETINYTNSSEPAVHHNHQEIVLTLFKKWS